MENLAKIYIFLNQREKLLNVSHKVFFLFFLKKKTFDGTTVISYFSKPF